MTAPSRWLLALRPLAALTILACILWPSVLRAQQRLPPISAISTAPAERPAEKLPPPEEEALRDACSSFLPGKRWNTPKRLDEISVDIRLRDETAEGRPEIEPRERPMDCWPGAPSTPGAAGPLSSVPLQFHWAAAGAGHQPLYFDDVPLERYGQTCHPLLQPWISGARFFAAFPIMPYKMTVDPPFERVSQLGFYRPGSPAPRVRQHPSWRADAALMEAGAWLAAIFLLP